MTSTQQQPLKQSSVDSEEIAKFAQHAKAWWDKEGPLKTLHDINDIRLRYIQSVTPLKGKRILDVGCGGGILSEGMAHVGGKVTGIDAEKQAITTAREHAELNHVSIRYQCTPIELFKAKPFSVITCLEMLEHVEEPRFIIEHAARLLAPGGYLILSTINRTLKAYAGVVIAAEYILDLLPRQTHDFKKFIKPSELATMVRQSGLEIVDVTGLAYNPFTRIASLTQSVDMNYLMVCRRELSK